VGVGYSVYGGGGGGGGYIPTKKAKKIGNDCRNLHPPPT